MDDATFARLTALERAEFLHASTLRRHGDMLDQHAERMVTLERMLGEQQRLQQSLQDLNTRLTDNQISFAATLASHDARLAALEDIAQRLTTTLEAITDLLNRPPNGR